MKVLIAGSRSIDDPETVFAAIAAAPWLVTEIITGGAKGVDRLAEQYAHDHGIPATVIKPNWRFGRGAGLANNTTLADAAEALIAIYDGESKGTRDIIRQMRRRGKPVHVVTWRSGASHPE